jgi:hypothetical protein
MGPALEPASDPGLRQKRMPCRTIPQLTTTPDLPHELDWIVLKALEPERDRRYGAVSELEAELERFIADEPVLAGPPSTVYRLSVFVRRHRLAVIAGALMLTSLLIAVVGLYLGFEEAKRNSPKCIAWPMCAASTS